MLKAFIRDKLEITIAFNLESYIYYTTKADFIESKDPQVAY